MGAIGPLLLAVAMNPVFENAAIALLEGLAAQFLATPSLPPDAKKIAEAIISEAPALVGAVVKNTPAASLVSPTIAAAATKAINVATTTT